MMSCWLLQSRAAWCSTAWPAYREQEITTKVFEEHANEIFEEAENRLLAQKAVMVTLMGSKED